MDGRNFRNALRRMRLFAGEAELTSEKVSDLIQPFIEEWKTVAVPNRKEVEPVMTPENMLSAPTLVDLAARVRTIGMNLHKQRLKGIEFHNTFQRQLVALAETFDCRGWMEAPAEYDTPKDELFADLVKVNQGPEPTVEKAAGRVDVIWARKRVAVAVFEVDSTVKARSFQKLKEAAAPHRFWVYFGKDVWGFRMFLQREDPDRQITPVIVPNTFVPSFSDPTRFEPPGGEGPSIAPKDLSE